MADLTAFSSARRPRRMAPPAWLAWPGRVLSAVAPGLAGAVLARLFTTPRRTRLRPEEKAWLLKSAARPLELAGGQPVPLYEWRRQPRGAGVVDEAPLPTVLLVHGMSGRAGQLGGLAEELAAAGFRVVAVDAPGHGAAPGLRSSLPELAQTVQEVAAHLGPLHGVAAHSNGAAAVMLALARGMRAERAVLLAPPEDLGAHLKRAAAALGFSSAAVRAAQVRLEWRHGVTFAALRGSRLVRGLHRPALILHDAADRVVPLEEAEALAASWPAARLRITQGLGHARILQDPEVLGEATDYLAETLRQ
ncbi:alpha/beta hydrolase [Roseobacteraceae bacterium NS-SX3]